jgi:phage-related baseplate assembly protein
MIAAFAIDDLTTPATTEEIKKSIYDVLGIVGVTTTNWKPGAVVRTIIAAVAIVLSAFSTLIALIARGGYLDLAAGWWLTLLAKYVYGVDRLLASFAVGEVTLTNAGGGIYSWDPDDLLLETESGRQFRNVEAVALGSSTSVTIVVRAVTAGSENSAFAGEIDRLVPEIANVSCTNALALIGQDEEADPALKQRCLDKLGSLSPNGPIDAYAYIARSAKRADGSAIGVTRIRHTKDGFGNIDLYVADPSGAITSADDLAAIAAEVKQKAEPYGVNARTHTATNVVVPVAYRIWLYNTLGLTQLQISQAIERSLASWARVVPIGGNPIDGVGGIYRSAIEAAIGSATHEGVKLPIFRIDLVSPSADMLLSVPEVPVLGAITPLGITQVAAAA